MGTGGEPESRVPLRMGVPATAEALTLVHEATRRIAAAHGFDPASAEEVAVAVGEAMSNVVEHAYRSEPGHEILLRFLPGPAALRIELEHRGEAPGELPTGVDLPRLARQRRRGGLGVHLMRQLMDRVLHEERSPGVGCWVLERRRPGPGNRRPPESLPPRPAP